MDRANHNWIYFAKWLPISKINAKSERVSTFNPKCRMPYNFVTAPFVREPIWQKNERRKKRSYVLLINNAQNVKQVMSNWVVAYKLQMEFQDLSNIHIYFFSCGVFILVLFRIDCIRILNFNTNVCFIKIRNKLSSLYLLRIFMKQRLFTVKL